MAMDFGKMAAYGGGAGLLGGLSGLLGGGGMMGKSGGAKQFQRFNPQQLSALQQLLSGGMQNADFGGIESRARKQFGEQTIPGLAERFTAMGNGQRSSAFQGALGQAGSDLESQLGALRSQYGMQQLGMGLTPQFENVMMPRRAGGLETGMSSLASLLPLLMFL